MDQYSSDTGNLNVIVTGTDSYSPLSSATIEIANTGEPNRILESITTDQNGQTGYIELSAPPREYSMEPTDNQPYSEYNLKISAPGYQEGLISGVQIFSGENGLQSIVLLPSEQTPDYVYNPIVIGGHTLWEYYPPKIAEPEIKPLAESGEIVLSRVVVPETIVVHDGVPSDSTATDYYVPYIDYIKNVACCEIYSTWPESTIEANLLAIMSFTLNRVYTEWYRNKGYDFTITSSTAFDHKWVFGRNIFSNISKHFSPLSRIIPIPAFPGAVDIAAIVLIFSSSIFKKVKVRHSTPTKIRTLTSDLYKIIFLLLQLFFYHFRLYCKF